MRLVLKTLCAVALIATHTTAIAKTKKKPMSDLKNETVKLKDNLKDLGDKKFDDFVFEIKAVFVEQKEAIKGLGGDQKASFEEQIASLEKEFEELEGKASDQKEKLYDQLVLKLEKLNDDIASETKK